MAKKKFNPFVLLYVISGILLIISIAPIADTARDIYSTKGRYSGYEEESLFNDFMEKDYSGLVKKINYNKGIGKSISDDEQDYYTFADAYKKAIDYNVYVNKGEYAKAEQIVKDIDNTQFNNVLFKEVLEKVKNTYIFEF